MKVAQILLLVAAIALLKVNSSWGQDVVATTAAGTVSAPDAGVPTGVTNLKAPAAAAAVVPVREQDSPKSTSVIQAKQQRTGAYGEGYDSITGECYRQYYGQQFQTKISCLGTGGIIAILLGILLLGLIAAVAVGVYLLKKGKLPQLMPRGGAGGTAA